MTYGKEEILNREVPELPAGQRVDEILFVEVLVGSYHVRPTSKSLEDDVPRGAKGPIRTLQKSRSSCVKNLAVSG